MPSSDGAGGPAGGPERRVPTLRMNLPRPPPLSRQSSTNSARLLQLSGGMLSSRPPSPGGAVTPDGGARATVGAGAAAGSSGTPTARGPAWMRDYFGSNGEPAPIPGTPSAPGTRAPSRQGSMSNLRQPLVSEPPSSPLTPGYPTASYHGTNDSNGVEHMRPADPFASTSRAASRIPYLRHISSNNPNSVFDEREDASESGDKRSDEVSGNRHLGITKNEDPSSLTAATFSLPHLSQRRSSVTAGRTRPDLSSGTGASSVAGVEPLEGRAYRRHGTSLLRSTGEKLQRVFLPSEPDDAALEQQAMEMKTLPPSGPDAGAETESQAAGKPLSGRPALLPNRMAEILFVMVCSCGQGLFSHLLGNVVVMTVVLTERLHMRTSQMPWQNGAFLLANGLSVTISGSLADIYGARVMIVGSLAWLTIANTLGAILMIPSVAGSNAIAFCFVRALQGLGIGGMTSSSVSYLGRVYKPGVRRNRVFSIMAGIAPVGYVTGGLHAAALVHHIPWLFGSMALATILLFFAALKAAPTERAMVRFERMTGSSGHPKRKFDFLGAALAIAGCGLVIFGLTQGSSANWEPYTYVTVILGVIILFIFIQVERRVREPLVPPHLWRIHLFGPMIGCYFMCYGSFAAAQLYAIRFWEDIQGRNPLQSALMMIPNAVIGITAAFLVARLFHILDGHYILGASCVAAMLMPFFFLLNHPSTNYFIFSMWGIALSTFSPDLSFAACSLFISNSVSRRYQGVASSILITMQNLSSALLTSLAETVGTAVEEKQYVVLTVPKQYREVGQYNTSWMGPGHHVVHGDGVTLNKLHAIWLFCLGGALLSLAICVLFLRIPKGEADGDHHED